MCFEDQKDVCSLNTAHSWQYHNWTAPDKGEQAVCLNISMYVYIYI